MKYFNRLLTAIFSALVAVIILSLSILGISIAILVSVKSNDGKSNIETSSLIEGEGFIAINDQRETKTSSSIEYDFKIKGMDKMHRQGTIIEEQANSIINNISSSNLTGAYSGTFVFDEDYNFLPFEESNDFQSTTALWDLEIDPTLNRLFFTEDANENFWTQFIFSTWNIDASGALIGYPGAPMNQWPTRFRFENKAIMVENFGHEGSAHPYDKWVNIEFVRNWTNSEEPPFKLYADANNDDSEDHVDYDNPDFYFDGFGNLSINGKSLKISNIWSEMDNAFYFENNGLLPILNKNFWFGSSYFEVDLNNDGQADNKVYLKSNKYDDKAEYYRLLELYIL